VFIGLQFQFGRLGYNSKPAVYVAVRPSVLDTVKPDNNENSRLKEENPALLE